MNSPMLSAYQLHRIASFTDAERVAFNALLTMGLTQINAFIIIDHFRANNQDVRFIRSA